MRVSERNSNNESRKNVSCNEFARENQGGDTRYGNEVLDIGVNRNTDESEFNPIHPCYQWLEILV
jgi:hypothetical protein